MRIEYLEEFIALATELSYSRVARQLNSSVSVLSKHVSALEKEVGKKLFERSTNHVALTPAGRAFYEGIAPIIDEYQDFIERFRAVRPTTHNHLTVALGLRPTNLMNACLRTSENLKENHQLVIVYQNASEGITPAAECLDSVSCLLTYDTSSLPENAVRLPLLSDPFIAIMRADHPLACRESVSLEGDLAFHRIIRLKGAFFRPGQDTIMDAFTSYGITPHATYSLASSLDDLPMLMNSRDVLILPKSAADNLGIAESSEHVALPFKEDLSFRLAAVYLPSHESEHLHLFADELKRQLQG